MIVIAAVDALECALLFGRHHFPAKALSLAYLGDRVGLQVQLALHCLAEDLQLNLLGILLFLLGQLESGAWLILGWLLRTACLLLCWHRIGPFLANTSQAAREQSLVKVIGEQLVERLLEFGTVLAHALSYLLGSLGVGLPFGVVVEVAASEPVDDYAEDAARALEGGRDLRELLQRRQGDVA